MAPKVALKILVTCILAFISHSSAFTATCTSQRHHQCTTTKSTSTLLHTPNHYPTDLDTAYEWIVQIRNNQQQGPSSIVISWFHPQDLESKSNPFHLEDAEQNHCQNYVKMPLYPVGAVHLPYCGNYTLNNVQERNVNMAKDLLNNYIWPSSLFCTSLRAKDTNRIASTATVMKVLQIEDRSVRNHNKIVVTCEAVGIAQVISIDNPQVWREGYVGGEYLVANVEIRDSIKRETDPQLHDWENASLANEIISNYNAVKAMYTNSRIASNELPHYAIEAIQTLPNFTSADIADEYAFWSFIETWQRLCNTIRQAKRNALYSAVNEMSVDAAMTTLDGPLELPVKRHRLPEVIQWKLNEMEQRASRDYVKMGTLDPVLDFQMLLEMKGHGDRVGKVAVMVKSELDRLEAKESLIRAFLDDGTVLDAERGFG